MEFYLFCIKPSMWCHKATMSYLIGRGEMWIYRQTCNIRHTLVGNKIVDHSVVVVASPVEAAPTTFST